MSSSKESGGRGLASKFASLSMNSRGGSSSSGALQRQKTVLRRRSAVSAEVTSQQEADAFRPKVVLKNNDANQRIQHALEKNYLFKYLDKEQAKTVIDAVEEVKYKASDIIIKQGDPGDRFYLLEEGTCEVWLLRPDSSEPQMVKEYSAGDSFGELALLYNAPRAATVKASTNCTLWAMDRMTFRTILLHTTSNKRKLYEKFLEDVPLLKTLDKYERSAIADVLEPEYIEAGKEILVEGQPGDNFYILEEGEAEARTGGKMVMKYKRGDYFGELALLNNKPRAATVIAVTQCKCVSIDRRSFKLEEDADLLVCHSPWSWLDLLTISHRCNQPLPSLLPSLQFPLLYSNRPYCPSSPLLLAAAASGDWFPPSITWSPPSSSNNRRSCLLRHTAARRGVGQGLVVEQH